MHCSSSLPCALLLLSAVIAPATPQTAGGIASSTSGNLALGRNITVSSTCGTDGATEYCFVADNKCYMCDDSQAALRHPAQFMIDAEGRIPTTWWQAENNLDLVTIQLDFETAFTFTYMVLTFRSYRPAAMVLERSSDFGRTWSAYQYFADSCQLRYGLADQNPNERSSLTQVICTSKYSDVAPSTGGEVVFSTLPTSVRLEDPYARYVLDHLSVTNLRIRLDRLIRLGDEHLDDRDEVVRKYYHAIYDWTVRGQCQCYGHASECVPVEGISYDPTYRDSMIFGICVCTDNTEGDSCERCKPLYNSVPWTPEGACKQCQCFGHADSCVFDADVFAASGNTDGGVCVGCRDNTAGNQCEQCAAGYYPAPGKLLADKDRCQACDCDQLGSKGRSGRCAQESDAAAGILLGDCECKTNLVGRTCDVCKEGTWNLTDENPLGCQDCGCFTVGTRSESIICNMVTGQCNCKRFVTGKTCDECLPEYYSLNLLNEDGCSPCECDPGGALSPVCNSISGLCQCRDNIHRQRCTAVWPGYYFQNIDHFVLEAEYSELGDLVNIEQRMLTDVTWTGHGYLGVQSGGSFSFTVQNISKSMPYDVLLRYEAPEDGEVLVTITHIPGSDGFVNGDVMDKASSECQSETPGVVHEISLSLPASAGEGIALSSASTCLLAKETYRIEVTFSSSGEGSQPTLIDSVVLLPSVDSVDIFRGTSLRDQWDQAGCYETRLRVSMHSNRSIICERLMFSMSAVINDGAIPCDCNEEGSYSPICWSFEGQCSCKPGVIGRRCDTCQPGFHGFSSLGCLACNCDPDGSSSEFCNVNTGQCPCIEGRTGSRCDNCEQYSYLDRSTRLCTPCNCNSIGSASLECGSSPVGDCTCRPGVTGPKCSQCLPGFYNFSSSGCLACECNRDGSVGSNCDERGQCTCRDGVMGLKCDQCTPDSFINPGVSTGCQRCFCSGHSSECDSAAGWYITSARSGFETPGDVDGWAANRGSVEWTAGRSLTGIPASNKEFLKWVAPQKYLGDKITAYTREFRFSLRQNATVPSDTPQPATYIELRRRNSPSVKAYYVLDPPPSNAWTQYTISFDENSWTADLEGSRISGFKLNQLLMQIDHIHIVTEYESGYPRAAMAQQISAVRMEYAVNSSISGGRVATHVEQCQCPEGRAGRYCEQCAQGWRRDPANAGPFESCVRCFCYFHSEQCHPETGECFNCLENTEGFRCDRCQAGFYGDAKMGVCEPCQCPGGVSGNQFADTCQEVKGDEDCPVRCNCRPGYTGCKCDECDTGYYGQPWREGGGCFNCHCSGNGPPGLLENCDKETGECKTCLYNTTGHQCEVCRDGFYGNASQQNCRACECDELGSESSVCDKDTGQCRCKVGVQGRTCDSCLPDHWGFKEGRGCVPCLCCEGAASSQCDADTGNCQCRPNIGGVDDIRCCLCQTGFWNYSTAGCQACDCDPDGSLPGLCDPGTGECSCRENVVGERCDRCRDGTSGVLPYCEPCGECFETWNAEVNRIRRKVANLTSYAEKITTTGSVTGFEDEFLEMERKLTNITAILNGTDRNYLLRIASNFSDLLNFTETQLDLIRRRVDKVEVTLRRTAIEVNGSSADVDELARRLGDIRDDIIELRDNMSQVEGTTQRGILKEMEALQERSRVAEQSVKDLEDDEMFKADRQTEKARDLVGATFTDQQKSNERQLSEAEMKLKDYERIVREAERDLCGKELSSTSCDPCGGVGCGYCGGPTCSGGANLTETAQRNVAEAKLLAEEKVSSLKRISDELSRALQNITEADRIAVEAQKRGLNAEHVSDEIKKNASAVLAAMVSFWQGDAQKLDDIRRLVDDISRMRHVISVEDFQDIIRMINNTIRAIQAGIGDIEDWTKELKQISEAQNKAQIANDNAEQLLAQYKRVEDKLQTAKDLQNRLREALDEATSLKTDIEDRIDSAQADVRDASAAISAAATGVEASAKQARQVLAQLDENQNNLNTANEEAQSARDQVDNTQEDLDTLKDELERLADNLDQAEKELTTKSQEAETLKKEADETLETIANKANEIKEFEKAVKDNDEEIAKLEKQADDYNNVIDALLRDIERKSVFHSTCTSGTS